MSTPTDMPPEHFRKLEKMYLSLPVNNQYDVTMHITEGQCEVTMPVRESYFHALNAMHGYMYFKLMDDTAFFAANSLVTDVFLLTVSFNLYFLRPVTGGMMRAVATCTHASRNLWIAETTVYNRPFPDAAEKIAGRGSGSFAKSKIELQPEIGYHLP